MQNYCLNGNKITNVGSKSAYAYTDSFFIITRYNGTEYQYLMSKNEHGVSRLTELGSTTTDESNGTSVKIPLKPQPYYTRYTESDQSKFYSACCKQLAYFENVYVDSGGLFSDTFNDAKLYHYENFVYTKLKPYADMHIKLGQCVYQMPWNDIELNSIAAPVGVKFDIGELMPTPNREGIVLDDDSKALIKERIKLTLNELQSIYDKQREDIDDWKEWYKMKLSSASAYTVVLGEDKIVLSNAVIDKKKIFLQGMSSDIDPNFFLKNWNYTRKIKNVLTTSGDRLFHPNHIIDNQVTYTIVGDFNKYKNKYIAEVLHPEDEVWIIRASKLKLRDYIKVLGLHSYLKSEWRWRIIEYQKLISGIWKELPSYDAVNPPKEWIKNQYKKRSTRDLTGKIIVYSARAPERTSENYAAYNKTTYDLKSFVESIEKRKGLCLYGTKDDRQLLDRVFMATYYDKSVLSVTYTAQHYHKHFEDSNHFINVHDFMKQFNKYFARAVTGWVADKFISDHQFFFDNINYIKHLNKTVADDLLWIKEYVDKYKRSDTGYRDWKYHEPKKFLEECWELAQANKLYDHTAVAKMNIARKWMDKANDLKCFATERSTNNLLPGTLGMARRGLKDRVKLDVWQKNTETTSEI